MFCSVCRLFFFFCSSFFLSLFLCAFLHERTNERTNEREQNLERMMEGERDDGAVWRLVTDHPDVFEKHVVPKLNVNDVKFFYDVNSESRRAIKGRVCNCLDAFKIGDHGVDLVVGFGEVF